MNVGTQILDASILFLNPIDKLSTHYRFTVVWHNFTTTLYLILCPIFDDFIIIVLDATHELLQEMLLTTKLSDCTSFFQVSFGKVRNI